MVWFKVEDTFALHPKVITVGNAPLGLWLRAGSWSASQLTDGFIPASLVATLGGKTADAHRLVAAGLWDEVDGGYRFHDWQHYQPTRADVEANRAAQRERQAKSRARGLSNMNGKDL